MVEYQRKGHLQYTHTPVYHNGNIWFTADKDGKTLYAIYALPEGEELPDTIEWAGNVPAGKVTLLDRNRKVKCIKNGDNVKVSLPKGLKNEPLALTFQVVSD